MNENIDELALKYVKKYFYSHVHVGDSWYALTDEYRAFKAGHEAAMKDNKAKCGWCGHDHDPRFSSCKYDNERK